MPNISLDIFFDQDILNVTATRSRTTPRVKPAWKVRTAPKLPLPEGPDPKTKHFGPQKLQGAPKTAASKPNSTPAASKPAASADKPAEGQPKKLPKLPPKARPQPKTQDSSE